ncbi:MAG: hypothetical protein R3E50_06275 [Halioglobus sp.]
MLRVVIATCQPWVDRSQQCAHGHAHIGEEDLRELVLAGQGGERFDGDPVQVHVHQQAGNTLVFRRLRIGAHQQLAVVGVMAQGVPDLLAVDDEMVAVLNGTAAQGGQVRAGVRFGKALAPDIVPASHARQERAFLLLGTPGHDGRGDVGQPDGIEGGRRIRAVHLLGEHHLLHHAGAASAVFGRPGDRRVAGVRQCAVPAAQGIDLRRRERAAIALAAQFIGEVLLQPLPDLAAKRQRLGWIAVIHQRAPGEVKCYGIRPGGRKSVLQDKYLVKQFPAVPYFFRPVTTAFFACSTGWAGRQAPTSNRQRAPPINGCKS